MLASPQHRKYIGDLSNLMENSGKGMSNYVMKIFKEIMNRSGNPATFIRNIRATKSKLQQGMNWKAAAVANKSFQLGKNFIEEKKK